MRKNGLRIKSDREQIGSSIKESCYWISPPILLLTTCWNVPTSYVRTLLEYFVSAAS